MKLGQLNSAIRELKGPPKIAYTKFSVGGATVTLRDLEVTKQSILHALKGAFPDASARTTETGLTIGADGHICTEDELVRVPVEFDEPQLPAAPVGDDLDDLLG
jgi:hypothetical protein